MQSVTLKWGTISGVIIFGIPLLTYFVFGGGSENYGIGEIIGYSAIVLSLLMIFAAINEYRKLQPNQRVSFGKGLLIGLLISAIAGTMFGVYNWIYVTFLDPGFMDEYYGYYIEQIRGSGKTAAEIEQAIQSYEAGKAFFASPVVQFATYFFTVFGIGLIISLFSAGVQSKLKSV